MVIHRINKTYKNVIVLIDDEPDLKNFYQAMREILKVSSIDLKYYFETLFPGENPKFNLVHDKKMRRAITLQN